MVASAMLASAEKSLSVSPYDSGPAVPARQAYSHCASVGSATRQPTLAESQRQKASASCCEIRTTGCLRLVQQPAEMPLAEAPRAFVLVAAVVGRIELGVLLVGHLEAGPSRTACSISHARPAGARRQAVVGSPMTNPPAGTSTISSVTPSPRSSVCVVAPAAAWRRCASAASNGQPRDVGRRRRQASAAASAGPARPAARGDSGISSGSSSMSGIQPCAG